MVDFNLGSSTISVRKTNEAEGEGESRKVVGIKHYVLTMTGEKGLKAQGHVEPSALAEAFEDVIQAEVARRLEVIRSDAEKGFEIMRNALDEARTSFNESNRGWQHKLGLSVRQKEA